MKQLLITILAGCGTLLPSTQLQAVEAVETFGGFAPGKTFTLTVTERFTSRTKGSRVTRNVPVPDSMPDFQEGQNVTFTIGLNGQLQGPGFSIAFRDEESRANFYSKHSSNRSKGASASVSKTRNDRPTRAALTFYKFKFSGFVPVTTTVNYALD